MSNPTSPCPLRPTGACSRREFLALGMSALAVRLAARAETPAVARSAWTLPKGVRITAITSTRYTVSHGRKIGRNSFKDHSASHADPLVRVQTSAGVEGLGNTLSAAALGRTLDELVEQRDGRLWLTGLGKQSLKPTDEAVLLDLVGKLVGQPAYALLGTVARKQVPMYDGSIYMRELDAGEGALREDVARGVAAGHTMFKIKIGRGHWLNDRTKGYDRDLWAIGEVRAAAGPHAQLMVDANNYYTPEEALRLVKDTATQPLYWMEEMLDERKPELHAGYRALRRAILDAKLPTLLADGESSRGTEPTILPLLQDGTINVSQPDIWNLGMFRYLDYGAEIRPYGTLVAPHGWSKYIGAFECCLLGMVMPNFSVIEDPRLTGQVVTMPAVTFRDGFMTPAATPGLGLVLDEAAFKRECADAKTQRI